jgi:ParB-like chromosome segregation protein Spo0J
MSATDDLAALETALIANKAGRRLNVVEEARACATLVKELNLTLEQMGARMGRSRSTVKAILYLLSLSDEILGFLERGELGVAQARTLLTVKDLEVREALARTAVAEDWTAATLAAHVERKKKNQRDGEVSVFAVAKAWGDALSLEVDARAEPFGWISVKLNFTSTAAALASAERLDDASVRRPTDPPDSG